jgi:hypothetical protein
VVVCFGSIDLNLQHSALCSVLTGNCIAGFQIVEFLKERGVKFISQLNELLGLSPFSLRGKGTRRGEGVNGLVDEVIAVLPVEKLKELFKNKLINSPDFRKLVEAIASPEFRVNIK